MDLCALSPSPISLLEIRRDRSNIGSLLLLTREARLNCFFWIGNAKIAGMSADLHLIGLRYNTAAAVFFVSS